RLRGAENPRALVPVARGRGSRPRFRRALDALGAFRATGTRDARSGAHRRHPLPGPRARTRRRHRGRGAERVMSIAILRLTLSYERDIVLARQRARHIAQALGFDSQSQTRIGTAVSEIARNAFSYAGGGRIAFALEGRTSPQ